MRAGGFDIHCIRENTGGEYSGAGGRARQKTPTLKRLSLELGGNAPLVVFDDADLAAAVEGAMASKFRSRGQICVCADRILMQTGIHDAFVARLAARVDPLSVGPGDVPGTSVGPMNNAAALEKIAADVEDALAWGATRVHAPR